MLCVICSSGGHLAEALIAVSATDVKRYFVTKNDEHVATRLEGSKVYYVVDPHTSPVKYLYNAIQSAWIYFKERPEVILTTGAGIALATCVLGKMFGSKLIFIESGARVTTLSRTGRILYKIADVTYVQWDSLQARYPRSIYVGRLE